jgi:ABC-type transporter Mla maintaining outer membrane lipid asymmetry ATPase subunit MlaF
MSKAPSILEFHAVGAGAAAPDPPVLEGVSFRLEPGQCLAALLEAPLPREVLADTAVGLLPPREGQVRFLDEEWISMPGERLERQRGQIGIVFAEPVWIKNLDLRENICLAQRHHSKRPTREILDEAEELARELGVPGIPEADPIDLPRELVAKAVCIRALLGKPALLLLDNPTQGLGADFLERLGQAVQRARKHGAAALWLSSEPAVWKSHVLAADLYAKTSGNRWVLGQGVES